MRFDIITLFPNLFEPLLTTGVTRRAFDSGLVDALEQWLVALAKQVERTGRDEPFLDDEEAVAIERRNLLGREPVDHERGRSLVGS